MCGEFPSMAVYPDWPMDPEGAQWSEEECRPSANTKADGKDQ